MLLGVEAKPHMKAFQHIGHEKALPQGSLLWSQDDSAGHGAVLLKGVLGVEKLSDRGECIVFTELQAGAILGEMSCLDGKPHSATVKALTDCTLRLFTQSEFEQLLVLNPQLLRELLVKQNERLRRLTNKMMQVGTEPVMRRLIYWLCEQTQSPISVTHHELAAQLATTRESVSKALSSLRRKKLVDSGRGRIRLLDKRQLALLLQAD
ncbi:MAG TPA: Crp/Fnr family transcriptional regulator [Phycisphaerales bacterium]|nr:Crp/Fnr family transcriptional regulator [Phycisphaerales bacterium]